MRCFIVVIFSYMDVIYIFDLLYGRLLALLQKALFKKKTPC